MIRIQSIELENFKNTRHGEIRIPYCEEGSCITGIYGQNGSGKTAVVEAMECVKRLLSGERLPREAGDYIAIDAESCKIKLSWLIDADSFAALPEIGQKAKHLDSMVKPSLVDDVISNGCVVNYEVRLEKCGGDTCVKRENLSCRAMHYRERMLIGHAVVEEELEDEAHQNPALQAAFGATGKEAQIDAREIGFAISPEAKWNSIKAITKSGKRSFERAEIVEYLNGRSFVFSDSFLSFIESSIFSAYSTRAAKLPSKAARDATSSILEPLHLILLALRKYGLTKLFVESTFRGIAAGANTLILDILKSQDGDSSNWEVVALDMRESTIASTNAIESIEYTFNAINQVLDQLVPGLSIVLSRGRQTKTESGEDAEMVMLMSQRDGVCFPLYCESEGIRKLVSLLVMFVKVYNDDETCLVVDELDASIFEFLLGELLDAIERHGKGQLLFTAHNLRPLETLSYQSIIVTTTDPENRYMPFKGVKPSNNVRDLYLRLINLGDGECRVYNPTSVPGISGALYDAAHPISESSLNTFLVLAEGEDGR